MTLVAWVRYHLLGRNKRTRNLVNVGVLLSLMMLLTLRRRSRNKAASTSIRGFTWPEFDFSIAQDTPHNGKTRILPMTEPSLTADWIYDTTNGSFWLPQPPSAEHLVSGYESRMEGNEYETGYFKGRSGFMHPDKIDILMAQSTGFNAGDFYALWIAPMISGRQANLPSDPTSNKNSLAVVGSILEWGARYVWGPGFIGSDRKLAKETEKVFAMRGPASYIIAMNSVTKEEQTVSPVYGDPGLLMSWFYQPHNQTKSYSLCLIPHYAENRAVALESILTGWKGSIHRINMQSDSLFQIMDSIVKCEFVLSSSLHGLIFADSYGIPNAHMNLTSGVTGKGYKFSDYGLALNRRIPSIDLINKTSADLDEIKAIVEKGGQPARINLMPLWEAAPMHAIAYNRTRQQHLDFAKVYAKKFSDTLAKDHINLNSFLDEMGIQH